MPRTIEKTIFKFEELSDTAKETARNWYRECSAGDNYFSESVIEDAATIAALMGIDLRQRAVKLMGGGTRYEPSIYWCGFWSQGDGASFEASYAYKRGSVAAVKAYAPKDTELHRIALELQNAQKRYLYKLNARVSQSGRYAHSHTMQFDIEHDADSYRDLATETVDAIEQAFRDFADWIYRQLETEYEYQNSNESVDETIRANEYEFSENGGLA
jgi:hypothetical protein